MSSAPVFAQTPNTQAPDTDVASPALQKEFEAFIAKFRAALKANDASAVAEMTKFPFGADPSVDAAQFRAKTYRSIFNAKIRTCIQRGKGVYSRDDYKNESYFIFCDDDIFVFTKTPAGFLFTEVGVND
ncbi:MAG: hypothetical protein KF807_06630 [Xanthobacteraceae bacterium]|nr:hypothetical protein [Xanthobacteraceae bacterium]